MRDTKSRGKSEKKKLEVGALPTGELKLTRDSGPSWKCDNKQREERVGRGGEAKSVHTARQPGIKRKAELVIIPGYKQGPKDSKREKRNIKERRQYTSRRGVKLKLRAKNARGPGHRRSTWKNRTNKTDTKREGSGNKPDGKSAELTVVVRGDAQHEEPPPKVGTPEKKGKGPARNEKGNKQQRGKTKRLQGNTHTG